MLWLRRLRPLLRPAELRFVRRALRRSGVLCRLRWAPGAMLRRPAPRIRPRKPGLPGPAGVLRAPAVLPGAAVRGPAAAVRGPAAAVRQEAVPAQAGAVRSKVAALRGLRRALRAK